MRTREQEDRHLADLWEAVHPQRAAMAFSDPTCPIVKNLVLLDSEGKRIAVKYYSNEWYVPVSARAARSQSACLRFLGRRALSAGQLWHHRLTLRRRCGARQAERTRGKKVHSSSADTAFKPGSREAPGPAAELHSSKGLLTSAL